MSRGAAPTTTTTTSAVILPSEFATFDFKRIRLARPISLMSSSDATFFIKLSINEDRPLVIQTTKCTTKKGIVKSSKKYYIDLVFDNYSEAIIKWLEGLEEHCKQEIVTGSGSESWFAEQPTMDDIDVLYTPIIKVKGRTYFMTTTIKTDDVKETPLVKIYNEAYKDVPWGDVGANTQFNTLLEIKGIRFSTRKIFIEIETKHIMILDDEKIFDTYLISSPVVRGGGGGGGGGGDAAAAAAAEPSEPTVEYLEPAAAGGVVAAADDTDVSASAGTDVPADDLKMYDDMMRTMHQDLQGEHPDLTLGDSGGDAAVAASTGDMMDGLEEMAIDVDMSEPAEGVIESKESRFLEIYRDVKQKLKDSKRGAILSYLTAKNIKNTDIVELQELNDEFEDEIDELDPLTLV